MILILTYHRIVEDANAIKGFFDVTAAELDKQVQRAKEIWGNNTSPRMLQGGENNRNSERTGFLVTFDDGTADHLLNAAPILERNGLTGVFFVSTDLVGTPSYLSAAQCRELVIRGHAIESHSHEHKILTKLSREESQRQLTESRRRLKEWGLGQWDLLAPPGGYFDASIMQAAKNEGYLGLRTLEWGYNRHVDTYRLQSITINRKTAERWFEPLISPRFESAKRLVYHCKETVKESLPAVYSRLRFSRGA
jgi:peptidoglycan/xylan/chitin deacetylase (PgdA/CDA1 family)